MEVNIRGAVHDGSFLVKEISTVITDWWQTIKTLFSKNSDSSFIDEPLQAIEDMMAIKRKIERGGVPSEEINSLRLEVAKTVDRGNMLLGFDVIIRDENGIPLDSDNISLLQTYEQHVSSQKSVSAQLREKTDFKDTGPSALLLSIKKVDLNTKYISEVGISFYDLEKRAYTTDSYVFLWNSGETKEKDLNLRALFVDFTQEDLAKRIVMVIRVINKAPIESHSATLKKNSVVSDVPESYFCRQMYAWEIIELSTLFNNQKLNNVKESVVFLKRDDDLSTALKSLQVTSRMPKQAVSEMNSSKFLINTSIVPGTVEEIRSKHPHLFSRSTAAILKRTDRPSTSNYDERNDLYVTLNQAELTGKSSEKNIEVRLHVVEANGTILENVFETVSVNGTQKATSYTSIVFYHENKPQWVENIKISLPKTAAHSIFLRLLFYSRKAYDKNKGEKGPFAISHIQLIYNDVFITDNEHELAVYKIDTNVFNDDMTLYMELPATKNEWKKMGSGATAQVSKMHTQGFSLSEKSSVSISTNLCSSVFTQNKHILNLLRWRRNSAELKHSLTVLAKPVGETETEMIRFMSHILDALFEIWHDSEKLELVVFDVIVAVLKLCEEPRFSNARLQLETYLDRFPFTTADVKILKCINHYLITNVETSNEQARLALRVIGSLFKFVMKANRAAEKFHEDSYNDQTFSTSINTLLKSLITLMGESRSRMAVQNTALKCIPSIIDLLHDSRACSAQDLCDFIENLIANFGKNIVARERLGFIAQIVETKFFMLPLSRERLIGPCRRLVLEHIEGDDVRVAEHGEFAERAADCASIVASILERLFPFSTTDVFMESELSTFILSVYRPLVRAMVRVIRENPMDDEARSHFFSVILSLLDKMSAQMFGTYVEERNSETDKLDFLMEMLMMSRDLLSRCPFPSTWKAMILQQNKIIHKALRFVMSAIQTYFSNENFCKEMWQEYMLTLVSFVTQDYADTSRGTFDQFFSLRTIAAKDIRSMWFRLSPSQKLLYIPNLVGSFLKVSLIDDEETRAAVIPIFFDMMQTEYNTSSSRSFNEFASELVSQLDLLVGEHTATMAFKEQFKELSTTRCQSDKDLMAHGGNEFIERIYRLLTHLIEFYNVKEEDAIDIRMSRTFQLLKYYHEFEHEELYVSYIYKLYNLHLMYGNEIEAAKTLLRHASLLTWEEKELKDWTITRNLNRHCANERQLKEVLINEVGELFAKGELWEDSLIYLKQLVHVYETMLIDYVKLADLYRKIATLYTKIDKEERTFFYFYLVGFYGTGFPDFLNGKRFVFRSNKLEMHGAFTQRLLEMYQNPKQIRSTDDCSHLRNEPGRHMQIFNIEPVAEECPFEDNSSINPSIKQYYRHYNIRNFEYSKVEERRNTKWTEVDESGEILRNWIIKRKIRTFETLPSELRFTEVTSVSDPIFISPLQCAVDQMAKKNKKLTEAMEMVVRNEVQTVKKLSGEVMGVVNAAVMGGVKNYEVFFTAKAAEAFEVEERTLALRLSELIVVQVEILEECIYVHRTRCTTDGDRDINAVLTDSFNKHREFVEQNFGKTGSRIPKQEKKRQSDSSNSESLHLQEVSGMSTLKSTKALGSAVANLINKKTSNASTSFASRWTNSIDSLSSTLRMSNTGGRLSIGISRNSSQSSTPTSTTNSSIDQIRFRPHNTSTLRVNTAAPPLPARHTELEALGTRPRRKTMDTTG